MKYVFTPSKSAFGETPVMRTIDVDLIVDAGAASIMATINDKTVTTSVLAHAAAFGIKQMLANSYAQSGTLKNKDGGLEPLSVRLADWQARFDKVLDKMTDPNATRNWSDVFTEGGTREPADPVESEVGKMVRAFLVAQAAKKGGKLPKADSDEYKALVARVLAVKGDDYRAKAREIVATRASVADDDFDLDLDGVDKGDEPNSEGANE